MAPARPAVPGRLPSLAVALLALLVCCVGFGNQLAWDDVPVVLGDARLHDLSQLGRLFTAPYWAPPAVPDLYRPVTSLLLAFQYVAGSGAPLVFRILSAALYAGLAVAVFRLAARICAPPMALFLALLFAVHPVHVEAVALAVGQAELLVSLFSVLAVTRYLDARRAGDGRLRTGDWGVLLACYLGASLAKEQGLLLPAFLLAVEAILVRGRSLRARAGELWRGYSVLLLCGVVVLAARTLVLGGRVAPPLPAEALQGVGLGGRALTLLHTIPEWLRLLVWPVHLRVEYRPPEFVASTGFGPQEALGALLLVGAVVIAWAARRRAPALTLGLVWLGIALFPISNLIVPTFILLAERTLLLPSVGFLLAVGGGIEAILSRHREVDPRLSRGLRVAALALLCTGAIRFAAREREWHDQKTLMRASVRASPRYWHGWQELGNALFAAGRNDEAAEAYRKAIAMAPSGWRTRNDFAIHLRAIGRDQEAVVQLEESLDQEPHQIVALAQLPPALIAVGRYAEARRMADSIIAIAGAPPIMVWVREVADSALKAGAPPGTVRIQVRNSP